MKQIDWTKVSSTNSIKHQFTVDVRNKLDSLSTTSDTIEDRYNNLIVSTEEVALNTLPKKEKSKISPLSATDLVKKAKKELLQAKNTYAIKRTRSSFKRVTQAQQQLDEAYATVDAAYIQGKIDHVSQLHDMQLPGLPSMKFQGGNKSHQYA